MKYKYIKQIVLGRDKDGRQVRKRIYANTKAELSRLETEAKEEFRRSPYKITFVDLSRKWLNSKHIEIATRNGYEACLKHCTAIESIPICNITKIDLQEIIDSVWDMPQTAKKVRVTLNQIFEYAIDAQICTFNPARNLNMPKLRKVQRSFLTKDQKNALFECSLPDRERAYVNILFYFRLRPGEALAFKSSDFDLRRRQLTVDKAVGFDKNGVSYTKTTKTGSVRILPIPDAAAKFLEYYCADKDHLFPGKNGGTISKSTQRRMWQNIKDAWGVTDITPYIFRYTYATDLYYSGIDLKKAAYLMGHSSTDMLLRVYAQLDDDRSDISVLLNRNMGNNL